ncbi:hypothetical protein IFM89_014885 [Coptis chinensis]|uniref:Uncharacterized protein n=1 Tax=Coptis chinensis TaxID=261450 RepID=A0A835HAZ8_9MAGN|nr:hypothetical protein IFM89_014885 [Coptis chinensis]
MGLQEAKLLQLPTACNLINANISDCPKLLNLAPNSPDMGIFTNSTNCNLVKANINDCSTLLEEKERVDQIYQDLSSFKDQAIQQEKLVSVIKSKFEETLGQTHLYEDKIAKLEKTLKLNIEDLEGANKEMKMLQVIIQQKENALSLVVARESGEKKQVESLSTYVWRLLKSLKSLKLKGKLNQ